MPHPALRRTPTRPRFDHGAPISAIDARPILFVVMLVTILVLLAASPRRMHALLVELPQPEAGLTGTGLPPAVHRISVTGSGELRFDGEPVNERKLEALLGIVSTLEPRAVLAFEPDGRAAYGRSAQALALIHRAGLVDQWFCIDGLEKHEGFGKDYGQKREGFGKGHGHPLPVLMTLVEGEWHLPPSPPMPVWPDIDTCAPQLFGVTGR